MRKIYMFVDFITNQNKKYEDEWTIDEQLTINPCADMWDLHVSRIEESAREQYASICTPGVCFVVGRFGDSAR